MSLGPAACAVRWDGASGSASAATRSAAGIAARVFMSSNLNSGMHILDAIGKTSMVRLQRVVPADCAAIHAKLEWENPTGSMKDRMALAVISRAEGDGRLPPGGTVVEYTGGSTGASLALVCGAKGYRIHIVTSDAFSRDKLDQMAALGAELTLVPVSYTHLTL